MPKIPNESDIGAIGAGAGGGAIRGSRCRGLQA